LVAAVTPSPVDALLARVIGEPAGDLDLAEDITARVLEAAREVFANAGVQRATMEDVARAAGFSRITVYRRFASKEALVEQVVLWEFRAYFDQFLRDIAGARTAADRVECGFVSSLRSMRGNSLIGGLLAAEPGSVVPAMLGAQSRTQAAVHEFLTSQLRREQDAGTIGADLDVALIAEMMVRVTTSFLVTPSTLIDIDDDRDVARVARQFLVPMLGPPAGAG
jgi:AcrR family transcriptional regulator